MENLYPHLLSPLVIRGQTLRNRVEFGPTLFAHSVFTIPEIRENVYRMVEDRAKGGAGIVSTGEICVNYEEGIAAFAEHPVDYTRTSGEDFEILAEYARRIKKHGAAAFFEVCHEGAYANVQEPFSPWGPDAFIREDGKPVCSFDRKMMRKVCRDFRRFGSFAAAAGFDGVLLHGGHGFLLQQFVSPRTNHRTDRYGGSIKNRSRFPVMILKALRKGLGPDKIIELRFSATDGVDEPDALTIEDTMAFAREIDGLADIFHVSNGLKSHGKSTGTFSSHYDPHGLNAEYAARIRSILKHTLVSVIGGISSPELGEEIIASGKADLIALGRQGFADPDFVCKTASGQADHIRRCVRCFHCYPGAAEHPSDVDWNERGLTPDLMRQVLSPAAMGICALNPDSGFGRVPYDQLPPVQDKKRILVVGGGPAGMQAAITASKRGHEVTLIEKQERLGGTVRLFAEADPFKKDYLSFLDVLEKETFESSRVITGRAATVEWISGFAADVTLIATGSQRSDPDRLDGSENLTDIRCAYIDKPSNKSVLILGGGLSACETAVFLADRGCTVTLLLRSRYLAPALFGGERNALLTQLEKRGIRLVYEARFRSVIPGTVHCVFPGDIEHAFHADILFSAMGSHPEDSLYRDLILSGLRLYTIGDASRPAKIADAIHGAYERAVSIGI